LLTHLLDTDVCIHAMKSRNMNLSRRLDALQGKSAISDITLYELYSGVQKYTSPEQRLEIIEGFVSRVVVLPFDTKCARVAGPLRYQLKTEGKMIGAYDLLIAATALANGLVLMTNNRREFNRVSGLQLESWE
jgi:tRNA(fMet)-specific endonuclease VapC